MGMFMDIMGWFLFFLGMLVWFIAFTVSSSNIVYDISDQGGYIEDKSVLINILETPATESTDIADEIILAINNKETKAKEEIDKILNSVYGRANKVCWTLWHYEEDSQKNLLNVECNSKKQILFDQETTLPYLPHGQPIKIRLAILGYIK